MKSLISILLLSGLLLGLSKVYAATPSDRQLQKAWDGIIDVLDGMAGDLDISVDRGKGTKHIKDAKASVAVLKRAIANYEKKGKGSKAVNDEIDDMERALKPLVTSLDHLAKARQWWEPVDGLEAACKKELVALEKEIDKVYKNTEDFDARDIDRLGKEFEDKIDDLVGLADKRINSVQARVKDANRFRVPHRDWDVIKKQIAETGKGYVRYLEGEFKKHQRVCYRMVSAVTNDELGDLEDLITDTQRDVEEYMDQSAEWLKTSRAIFTISCHAKQKLRKLVCARDEAADDPGLAQAVNREVGEQKRVITAKLREIVSEYGDLKKTGDALLKIGDYDDVDDRYDELRLRASKLLKLAKAPVYKGYRDPELQEVTTYGTDRHDQLQGSMGCDLSETKIAGSNRRWDCFQADKCLVLEFKPKGYKGNAAGQAADYAKDMSDFWGRKIKAVLADINSGKIVSKTYNSAKDPRPPADVIEKELRGDPLAEVYAEMLGASGCIRNDGNVRMKSKVHYYEPCDKKYPLRCDDPLRKY